ncbi:MAG: tktA [Gammaproteobacteria bacterium]|jgi:transketolase|nr:tktA [Gammaproteobacteria bacterium]
MLSRRNLANAVRFLSMDAVQQANSGHPGMPMGMADIAEVLWNDFLRHNPNNPNWPNRDRFILSNGHGSMLHYSLLHLSGYDLSIEELKHFRQLHSKTPGHPEYGYTPGVETTTGPLGQGLANAVGMALAEKILAAHFKQTGFDIIDHYTYVFLGDGCLMEGISHEVCSLAGTLGLGKLIAFWDDNGISIDGEVEGWFTDNTPKRFEAYGWHVISGVDGHDSEAIKQAIVKARLETERPSLICCKTTIGFGSPNKAGTESTHGAPLGADEIAATRKALGWEYPAFEVPAAIKQAWDACERGQKWEAEWQKSFAGYQKAHPEFAKEFERRLSRKLPENWLEFSQNWLAEINGQAATIASRKASQDALNKLGPVLPELLGGSADLAGSNLTMWKGSKPVSKHDANANYLYYGVREFGMSAIANGIALYSGFIPYSGTFLVFSDYARNALRMAALMRQRNIFVYTHDSIGLGEDGPTHQPIEHLASLRLIPNMSLWRPCDAVETVAAWTAAIERKDGPTCLIFSRQNLAHQLRDQEALHNIKKGGYILKDCDNPELILLATGSEVDLAVKAAAALTEQKRRVRVVSMPSTDVFDIQAESYRKKVLPAGIPVIAIEAGVSQFWKAYVGDKGKVIGLDRFGESAPAPALFEYFGFTVKHVLEVANSLLA